MTKLELTSPAFSDGGEMPREYGYKHGNITPPLKIKCAYTRIKSLALIMDDPDAMEPAGKVWVHWVVWNIDPLALKQFPCPPYQTQTPEIECNSKGMNDFGEVGYGGPAPPDKTHTYVFKLYALDIWLRDLPDKSTKADVEKAMDGYILDHATLTGTYAP